MIAANDLPDFVSCSPGVGEGGGGGKVLRQLFLQVPGVCSGDDKLQVFICVVSKIFRKGVT